MPPRKRPVKVKHGQPMLPEMDGDLGRSERARQWRELRTAIQAAITLMRTTHQRSGIGIYADTADHLERSINRMPTI